MASFGVRHWAILPETLRALDGISANRLNWGQRQSGSVRAERIGPVAVIPIAGVILPRRVAWSDLLDISVLDEIGRDIGQAVKDPGVAQIVLEIDSPGGAVNGIGELASTIRQVKKPTTAMVTGLAASGAYWLAAAAGQVVIGRGSMVGSLGVVAVASRQEKHDQAGEMAYEVVSSNAPLKRPDPSTDEGRAAIRRELDALESVMNSDIAGGRGVSVDVVLSNFGRGAMFTADEAIARGMADRAMTFDELLAALTKNPNGEIARRPQAAGHPAAPAPANAPPQDATARDWVTAERRRVSAILGVARRHPGHDAEVAAAIRDGATAADLILTIEGIDDARRGRERT